jgi:beta-glucosidase
MTPNFKTSCWILSLACISCFSFNLNAQVAQKWSYERQGEISVVNNPGGASIGVSSSSGVKLITVDGFAFKDLNKNGKLDKYEDWRLSADERAKDLAAKMTVEQIAGLMLYSAHQAIPAMARFGQQPTYNGKAFPESGADPSELSDQQKKFLTQDNLRHVLVTTVQTPEIAARWNNKMQSLVEGIGLGIPANNSTDPRHGTTATTEYNEGSGSQISQWPESLGMAATFSPELVRRFGEIASREYRALGISTALSPQIDLGTEPRWSRINGTFGEDPYLDADMARAYVDGFQTSTGKDEIRDGWGYTSVNAMVKHWPSGGPEEAGRDAHFAYGKFAVYPGNNFQMQMYPFVNGAFKLKGKTGMASAVMPYYTISYGQDKVNGENVGNGYSKYLVTDLLRKRYGYDGVVCTDWLVTADEGKTPDQFVGKSWGMENKTVAERHYKVLMAGVDQFGGNNDAGPVLEAYQMGVKEHGEAFMRARFEVSAVRLLKNIFRVGLFENPYLDPEQTKSTVGNPAFVKEGYQTQVKSIVMLKNGKKTMPVAKGKTVYIPKRVIPSTRDWFGNKTQEKIEFPANLDVVKKYYNVTEDPSKADFAIVFVQSPNGGVGYDLDDRKNGGNGYLPISLQYGPYKAEYARENSIAAGDPVIDPTITNRSYKNKTITATNEADLKSILDTRAAMKGKPVIVVIAASKPMVFQEFEQQVDGILIGFGVQQQAMFDIISGAAEPSGLLPVQMPASMKTVELQMEDLPHDMDVHKDSDGNKYDFGFGLNWKGVIRDARTARYIPKKK